jgi:hypothetical protein
VSPTCGGGHRAPLHQATAQGCGRLRWPADVGLNPQRLAVGADGDRPVLVGAKGVRPSRMVGLDHPRVGVTEPAILLRGKYCDARSHGPHEGIAAGYAAAMIERLAYDLKHMACEFGLLTSILNSLRSRDAHSKVDSLIQTICAGSSPLIA